MNTKKQQTLINNFLSVSVKIFSGIGTAEGLSELLKEYSYDLVDYFRKLNRSVIEIPCPKCEGEGCYCEFTDLCGVGEKCIDAKKYGSRKCKSCNGSGKVKAVIMED